MPKHGREINLSLGIEQAMAFNDPRLSDREFEKQLVSEIYNDDLAVKDGTSSLQYCTRTLEKAQECVTEAIKLHGLSDRNKVITEAYNRAGNSKPTAGLPKLESTFLDGSDYLDKARKDSIDAMKQVKRMFRR